MAHSLGEYRVLSRPVPVLWAGWKSDTFTLQQHGWELSAEQDVLRCAMRIALRHQGLRCIGLSSPITWEFERLYHSPTVAPPPISIAYIGTNLEVRVAEMSMPNFKPIDAAPQFLSAHVVKGWDDLNWFAAPLARTEEIIVEPQEVGAMLEQIRKLQAPEQARIRHVERLRERREGMEVGAMPRQKFHAQIISLAEAA